VWGALRVRAFGVIPALAGFVPKIFAGLAVQQGTRGEPRWGHVLRVSHAYVSALSTGYVNVRVRMHADLSALVTAER